jgi:hypothetical protein
MRCHVWWQPPAQNCASPLHVKLVSQVESTRRRLTFGNVVVSFDGNVLMAFRVVDIFQDFESMSSTYHANLSQIVTGEYHEYFAVNSVFCCTGQSMAASLGGTTILRKS